MLNGTWETIVKKAVPIDYKILEGKWVFKIKKDKIYKARWIIKNYKQIEDINY